MTDQGVRFAPNGSWDLVRWVARIGGRHDRPRTRGTDPAGQALSRHRDPKAVAPSPTRLQRRGPIRAFPVTLIVAPAGYGKSTLMAQWHGKLRERGVSCAWLSLDENDDDMVRFIRHLNAALQQANPHLGGMAARYFNLHDGAKPLLEALADATCDDPRAPRAFFGRPAFRTKSGGSRYRGLAGELRAAPCPANHR